ncbi:MAG: TonB family protein, partial [Beijerinckiaceae bacterium]
MNEAELNAADRVPQEADAPPPWDDKVSLSVEAGGATRSETVLPSSGEAPASSFPAAPMRACAFPSRRSEGGLLAAAASLAAHALVIAGLLFYAPWDGRGSLQDEDEISVEIVDSLPQAAPSPEPAASTEQARPAAPEAKASEVAPAPAQPSPPVPEAEANPPPAEAMPPPVEAQAPPPVVPAAESALQTPPPAPTPIEAVAPPPEPPVRQAEPAKLVPPAVDLAQRERAERLEREKRDEAEKAVRERAARAAENAKRQEAQRQEAQRQAAQRQEAERQTQAKAAEAAAANAAAASAYRSSVIGHLASFKRYPPAARARGAQGNPAVSFSIDTSGRVVSVSLTRASGDPDIDAEIVAMVHRASP